MITGALCIFGYAAVAAVWFVFFAWWTDTLDDPWDTPAPCLGGLLWPIGVPLIVLGYGTHRICKALAKRQSDRRESDQELRRRIEELEEELKRNPS